MLRLLLSNIGMNVVGSPIWALSNADLVLFGTPDKGDKEALTNVVREVILTWLQKE